MYIEYKGDGLEGHGRIGWVELSKSKRTYKYKGKSLKKIKGGYKFNCVDMESGEHYWVSGPNKNGQDRMYGGIVEIDEDAKEEYWINIRKLSENKNNNSYRCQSIYEN